MIGELAALGAAISWTASALLYGEALRRTKPIPASYHQRIAAAIGSRHGHDLTIVVAHPSHDFWLRCEEVGC